MKLSETKFKVIKMYQQSGATIAETAKSLEISESTVAAAFVSHSVDEVQKKQMDYMRSNNPKHNQASEARKQPIQTVVKIEATQYMMEELRQMNKHLEMISNKMAFIVEELIPEERRK